MDARQQADDIRRQVSEHIRRIQADNDLTIEAKGRQIADVRAKGNTDLARVRAAAAKEANEEHTDLLNRAFGLGGFTLSATNTDKELRGMAYRAALIDALKIADSKEAVRRISLAKLVNDPMLAKATAAVAYERSWGDALDEYASFSPSVSEHMNGIKALESRPSRTQAATEMAAFASIPEPPEERSLSAFERMGSAA